MTQHISRPARSVIHQKMHVCQILFPLLYPLILIDSIGTAPVPPSTTPRLLTQRFLQ
jgi:hypothetical protein